MKLRSLKDTTGTGTTRSTAIIIREAIKCSSPRVFSHFRGEANIVGVQTSVDKLTIILFYAGSTINGTYIPSLQHFDLLSKNLVYYREFQRQTSSMH